MSETIETEVGFIPAHWTVSTIQQETEFVTDYVANGSFAALAEHVNYKAEPDFAVLIRLTDFNNSFMGDFVYVDQHAYDFLRKSKLYGGELIISNVGAYAGTVFLAPKLNRPMTLGPNSVMMNFKNGNTFYFYWLKSPMGRFLLDGIISGSAQPKFNKTTFRQMNVPVPPLPEQQAVATVLSSLDDKIDLLHRQNRTLEAMAETLFRQWFIEEATANWTEKMLGEYFPVITGKKDANISTEDGQYPFFTCSQNTLRTPSYSFEGQAILLAGNGDFNIKRYIGKFEAYQRTYVLIPIDTRYYNFLYVLMKYFLSEITGGYQGSVINFITKSMITDFRFNIPNEDITDKLNILDSIFFKYDQNTSHIRSLQTIRDTLLPKLMSGEVRVAV